MALLTDRVGGVLRALKLNTPHEAIVHARAALLKHPRHLHGSDEARVFLTLSGKSLSATRTGDTLENALYAVFDVMQRELHDFRPQSRRVVRINVWIEYQFSW